MSWSCSIPHISQKCKFMENLKTTCIIIEMSWRLSQCKHCSFPTERYLHICVKAVVVHSNSVHTSIWIQLLWSELHMKMMTRKKSLPAHLKSCSSSPTVNPHNRAPSNYMLRVTMETLVLVSARLDYLTPSVSFLSFWMEMLKALSSTITLRPYL